MRHPSKDFDQFNYFLGLLRKAVAAMILQVGSSIAMFWVV
jgi:hypothetical protein